MLDQALCREAFEARDRAADGKFVVGVVTTGIYCRPSCPARRPRPENVRFYADGASARADGLRACLRCRPDEPDSVEAGILSAVALIESAETPPRSEAHTSELQYLMRTPYAVFCSTKK